VGVLLRGARRRRAVAARTLSLQAGLSPAVAGKVESGAVDPCLSTFGRLVVELELNDREIALLVRLAALRR
jgi:predicted transcriptional regulator